MAGRHTDLRPQSSKLQPLNCSVKQCAMQRANALSESSVKPINGEADVTSPIHYPIIYFDVFSPTMPQRLDR